MKRTMKSALTVITAVAALLTIGTTDGKAASTIYDMVKTNHITFEAAAPKTILDSKGQGTGFTTRLPGTGSGLLKSDVNLTKNRNGLLSIQSTYTDINVGGVNLNNMETLAVPLTNIGKNDFAFSVVLRNVQVPDMSDQIFAFVGTGAKNIFRFGPHGNGSNVAELLSVESLNGGDFNHRSAGSFTNGSDIKITLTRTGVKNYTIEYSNLTDPTQSATQVIEFNGLNNATTLYVGVLYSNAGSSTQKTSLIEDFRVYKK